MEILLQDIKRVLGAKRIYLPGSAEEAAYHDRIAELANGNVTAHTGQLRVQERERQTVEVSPERRIPEIERSLQGLGIVDTTSSSTPASTSNVSRAGKPIPKPPPSRRSSAKPSPRSSTPSSTLSSRLLPPIELPLINGVPVPSINAIPDPKHPDKETVPLPVPISRVVRVKDGMIDAGNGWVEMGVGVGAGRGGRVV